MTSSSEDGLTLSDKQGWSTAHSRAVLWQDINSDPLRGKDRPSPWVMKIPCRREWLPTPVLLPGEVHGQRNLVGYSHRVRHNWVTDTFTFSLFIVPFSLSTFWVFVVFFFLAMKSRTSWQIGKPQNHHCILTFCSCLVVLLFCQRFNVSWAEPTSILFFPLPSCVSLGKLFYLCLLICPHLWHGEGKNNISVSI